MVREARVPNRSHTTFGKNLARLPPSCTMASMDFRPVAVRSTYYGRAESKAAAVEWVDQAHTRQTPSPALYASLQYRCAHPRTILYRSCRVWMCGTKRWASSPLENMRLQARCCSGRTCASRRFLLRQLSQRYRILVVRHDTLCIRRLSSGSGPSTQRRGSGKACGRILARSDAT